MKKIELLAPAGDLEKLKIDVLYGADAVYIGGKAFSLRAGATNFTKEDMIEGVKFAHEHGVKVHVTFNIYPNDGDEKKIDEYLLELDEIGVDAIIVSSLYVINRAKALGVHYELHSSTQESTTSSYAVNFWAKQGCARAVLGREATLEEIKRIREKTKTDIEVFIHGAMCCSVSGRCTLSNYYTKRDANKGACSHPCRWTYSLYRNDKKVTDEFLLGSKDLMTVDYIKDLIEIGVSSLKIEGRMKSVNYLAHVVKTYRRLIDDIYDNKVKDYEKYENEIAQSGNRSFTKAWIKGYTDHNDLIYSFSNTPLQNYLGMILDYDKEKHMCLLQAKNPFNVGDVIELVSFKKDVRSFIVTKLIDEKGNDVQSANNPFFTYWVEIPYEVEKYEILRKTI
jgi:putative protease